MRLPDADAMARPRLSRTTHATQPIHALRSRLRPMRASARSTRKAWRLSCRVWCRHPAKAAASAVRRHLCAASAACASARDERACALSSAAPQTLNAKRMQCCCSTRRRSAAQRQMSTCVRHTRHADVSMSPRERPGSSGASIAAAPSATTRAPGVPYTREGKRSLPSRSAARARSSSLTAPTWPPPSRTAGSDATTGASRQSSCADAIAIAAAAGAAAPCAVSSGNDPTTCCQSISCSALAPAAPFPKRSTAPLARSAAREASSSMPSPSSSSSGAVDCCSCCAVHCQFHCQSLASSLGTMASAHARKALASSRNRRVPSLRANSVGSCSGASPWSSSAEASRSASYSAERSAICSSSQQTLWCRTTSTTDDPMLPGAASCELPACASCARSPGHDPAPLRLTAELRSCAKRLRTPPVISASIMSACGYGDAGCARTSAWLGAVASAARSIASGGETNCSGRAAAWPCRSCSCSARSASSASRAYACRTYA